jgi:hypothetical protein
VKESPLHRVQQALRKTVKSIKPFKQ